MTAYNAYRASAVIALQYLGRLWLPASRTRRNECGELVATTKREQQNMLSDLYFTCYSQEGWGLYQWLGPKHGTNSRIALRVSARITQYRLVWTDQYRERDWGTGARSGWRHPRRRRVGRVGCVRAEGRYHSTPKAVMVLKCENGEKVMSRN